MSSLPNINKWRMDNKPTINGSNIQKPLILYGLNILIMNKTIHSIVVREDKNGVKSAYPIRRTSKWLEYLTTFTTWLDSSTLANTIPNEEGITSNTKAIVKNTSDKIVRTWNILTLTEQKMSKKNLWNCIRDIHSIWWPIRDSNPWMIPWEGTELSHFSNRPAKIFNHKGYWISI